jgi:hypothetical protein
MMVTDSQPSFNRLLAQYILVLSVIIYNYKATLKYDKYRCIFYLESGGLYSIAAGMFTWIWMDFILCAAHQRSTAMG